MVKYYASTTFIFVLKKADKLSSSWATEKKKQMKSALKGGSPSCWAEWTVLQC